MAKYKDIISRALLEIGVVEGGEEPEAHLLTEGFSQLREMLDQWALEGLLVPGVSEYTHTFTNDSAAGTITIGPAASNPTITVSDVPYRIDHIEYTSTIRQFSYPLEVLSGQLFLDNQQYYQDAVNDPPTLYWYIPELPAGQIRFNVIPTVSDKIVITAPKHLLTGTETTESEAVFLRGYEKAIRLNLAVELASSTGIRGQQLSPVTVHNAKMAKEEVALLNAQRLGQSRLEQGALMNSRRYTLGGRHYVRDRFNY